MIGENKNWRLKIEYESVQFRIENESLRVRMRIEDRVLIGENENED